MKITLKEWEGCFGFDLEAESMQDAALLVRMGMNATKEIRHISATANQDGTFHGSLVLGKHKSANNDIPRRK